VAFLSGWNKRIKLTIDKDQVDTANQTNFPVMVYISAASGIGDVDASCVFDELTQDANRKKIAVTSSDGTTELYVEIERWDDANEKAWLHVKVPSVSHTVDEILYLYYDKDHADNDTYVGDTTDAVTHNVWDEHFCYDDQTEILTEDGWKLFENLNQSEKVATLNQHTQEIEYKKPYRYISYDYMGDLVSIQKSQQLDLAVIPDHNMYVSERKSNWSKYNLRKAKDIFDIPVRYKKDGCWVGKKQDVFVLPSVVHEYGTTNQYSIGPIKEKRVPEVAIDMNVWVEFLGYFLSEGCTIYHGKGVRRKYAVTIAQSLSHPEYRNRIRTCLQNLPFKFHESDNGFTINNKQLASYTKQFGKDSKRYIPKHIKRLSKPQLKILFDALMLGDGAATGTSYSTISKALADDFQELLLKIGTAGNVYRYSNGRRTPIYTISVITGKKFGQLHPYIWNRDKTGRTACHKWITYNGKVYSVEVENHVIYVRRNGKGVWGGNCAVYHMAQDPNGDGADAIKDSTSNQNDMTPEGTMLTEDLVDGKVGKCLVFDGSNDCLIVSDNASMDFTGGLTVEAIIEGDGETIIAGQWDTEAGDGDERCFNLQINAAKKVQGVISPTGSATDVVSEGTTVVQAATWYHSVLMCDLSNQYIYLNGNQEDSDVSESIINSTNYLTIAAIKGNTGTTAAWRNGKIDEVRFSNINRSAPWIKATYHSLWDSLITFGAEEGPDGGTVTAEPLSGTLSLSGAVIGPMAVAADPLEAVGSISGVGVYIPRSQITGTLTLINSLKVGGTLTLINSLNVQVTGSVNLVNNLLQKIEGTLTIRNDIEERAKFNGTLNLINHILDAETQTRELLLVVILLQPQAMLILVDMLPPHQYIILMEVS